MPAVRGARVPTKIDNCEIHGKVEHRQYRRGRRVKTGEPVTQWRCYPCLQASDARNKESKGVKVGELERKRAERAAQGSTADGSDGAAAPAEHPHAASA